MLLNLLGKKNHLKDDSKKVYLELVHEISKMKLSDMRAYVNNKTPNFEVTENGLIEVMRKLIVEDKNTSKRYINFDDMDSKIKNAFELVLLILNHRKISVLCIEFCQEFMNIYDEIIKKYDTEHKDIYHSRLIKAIQLAVEKVNTKTDLAEKINLIDGHKGS